MSWKELRVQTFEDFLPNAEAYRDFLAAQEFYNIRHSDGEIYKHVNVRPPSEIRPHLEAGLKKPVTIDLCLARMNFADELPNNAIHTDESFSPFAYILYLSRPQDCKGGTAFWIHRKYQWLGFPTDGDVLKTGKSKKRIYEMLREDMQNADAWEQVHFAEMKFNKCICFPCSQWHSRWPFEAFGNSKETARLINVGFFDVQS
jgi:hypothetical protein